MQLLILTVGVKQGLKQLKELPGHSFDTRHGSYCTAYNKSRTPGVANRMGILETRPVLLQPAAKYPLVLF